MEQDIIFALLILIVISLIYTTACCAEKRVEKIDMPLILDNIHYSLIPKSTAIKPIKNSFMIDKKIYLDIGGTSVGRSQRMIANATNSL